MIRTNILRKTQVRKTAIAGVIVLSAIYIPSLFHFTGFGGPQLLPLHLFALLAGVVLGVRLGPLVALLSPILSYIISGMPPQAILGQIIAETVLVSFLSAYFFYRRSENPAWIIPIILVGKIALFSYIFLSSFSFDQAISTTLSSLSISKVGLLIQLVVIPLVVIMKKWKKSGTPFSTTKS